GSPARREKPKPRKSGNRACRTIEEQVLTSHECPVEATGLGKPRNRWPFTATKRRSSTTRGYNDSLTRNALCSLSRGLRSQQSVYRLFSEVRLERLPFTIGLWSNTASG